MKPFLLFMATFGGGLVLLLLVIAALKALS
jgi:hypothetical protein